MGASTGVSQFVGKLDECAKALQKAPKDAVMAAADILKAGATRTMLAATHGDSNLHNIKKSKLAVKTRKQGVDIVVYAPGGAYSILDRATKAHYIGGGRSTKVLKGKRSGELGPARPGKGGGSFISFGPDKGVRFGRFLQHGTKGKHTFQEGIDATSDEALKRLADLHISAFEKVWR